MSVMVARQRERALETEELDPRVMRELLRHPGKWAAVKGARVLAIAGDPAIALQRARKRGVQEPLLFRVPDSSVCLY